MVEFESTQQQVEKGASATEMLQTSRQNIFYCSKGKKLIEPENKRPILTYKRKFNEAPMISHHVRHVRLQHGKKKRRIFFLSTPCRAVSNE